MNKNINKNEDRKKNIRKIFFWLFGVLFLMLLFITYFLISKINKLEGNIKNNINTNEKINGKIDNNIVTKNKKDSNKMIISIPELFYSEEDNKFTVKFNKFEVEKTDSVFNETLKKLFEIRMTDGTWNGLKFEKAFVNNDGVATVVLSGKWKSNGDISKMYFKREIEEAIFQYDSVKDIKVVLNNSIFDWCVDGGEDNKKCSDKNELWDTRIIKKKEKSRKISRKKVRKILKATKQEAWKPCDGLFIYDINNGDGNIYIDTEMDHQSLPLVISTGYEIRGCVRKINGSYGHWAPNEGSIGYFEIKDGDGNVLLRDGLSAILTNNKYPDWMTASIAGEKLGFRKKIGYNFNSVLGQKGTLEIHNENPSGSLVRDRIKVYKIIFGT